MMNKFFLALILAVNFTAFGEVIEDSSKLTIETPALAKRETRKLRLENGLEALLISDPETPESGAALAVNVGSWEDPVDRPGMAHFVEHLLFLGTKKYPEEEGYSRYLDEHGGKQNAFTMNDRTVYMFSINNEGFEEALDRFGQFFVAPLFSSSGVGRECKAIHQEYCKNVPLDPWRIIHVKKELANPSHPFHAFSIGNNETLAAISHEEVKEWYQSHYSSNLMHLVIYSPLDLDTLEEQVTTIFSEVKDLDRKPVVYQDSLFSKVKGANLISVTPYQDVQMLELAWEIPRFYGNDHEFHIEKLVSHVLGHEGSSSLLAQLKQENLAESLGAGTFRAGNDQGLLLLSVQLTSKGVQEYERVIERCYEGIASLKKSGIPRFIFDEVQQLETMRYSFQSRQEIFHLVTEYAMNLVDEPLESFPSKTLIPTTYSPEKINEFFSYLTPENCLFTLVAHPHLTQIKPTQKERWLAVDYALSEIPREKILAWTELKPHREISIPRPNHFIPEQLKISEKATEAAPKLIVDQPNGRLFSCQDETFLVPEICWTFKIKTPEISDANPKSHVLADIFCHAVDEKLNATAYEALVAGLSYSLQPTHNGIELKIRGYGDKAGEFLQTILTTLKTTEPTEEQFIQYRELFRRDYQNGANISPLKQGGEILWGILYKDYAGLTSKSKAIEHISYEQAVKFSQDVFRESYVEGTLFGNLAENTVWNTFENTLISEPYLPHRHPKLELATLPEHDHPSFLQMRSEHPANALILAADCGDFSFKRRAAQEILAKGLEEPFFSELRTRQQTAYVVSSWSQELERHLYTFFAIQSSSHDTRDLLSRFELFLEDSLQHLSENVIPEERFESIRQALIYKLENPAENLVKQGELIHRLGFEYDGDFEWLDKRIAAIRELTYEEFVSYAHEFLGSENPRRLAICVNGSLPTKGRVSYRKITTPEKIRGEICYRGRE